MGSLVCQHGRWNGTLSGCTLDPGSDGGVCGAPYQQIGYSLPNCGRNTPGGTTCTAKCAEGFFGTPTGSVACVDGKWLGSLAGCGKPCSLPSWLCIPGKGIGYQFSAYTLQAHHTLNKDDCTVYSQNDAAQGSRDLVQVRVGCRRGYYAKSETATNVQADSVCLDGELIGGFSAAPYVCESFGADENAAKCECGLPNEKKPTVRINSGLHTFAPETVNNTGVLKCWKLGQDVSCTCTCPDPVIPPPQENACGPFPQTEYTVKCDPATSACTASCAPGYCGAVSGSVTCDEVSGIYGGGSLDGCMPCPCAAPFRQAGYDAPDCQGGAAHGDTCPTARCSVGYTGAASGTPPQCSNGVWTGEFSGCTPAVCEDAYETPWATGKSECAGGALHGTKCMPDACRTGACGTPTGGVRCEFGKWIGEGFGGCKVCDGFCDAAASAPSEGGYRPLKQGLVKVGDRVNLYECAPGYAGSATGERECGADLEWTDYNTLTGCFPAECDPSYATEWGTYAVSESTLQAHGTTITVMSCGTNGFSGTANGTKTCAYGGWVGEFTGCEQTGATACSAPAPSLPAMYVSGGACAGGSPSGSLCVAVKCASGNYGQAYGGVRCNNGVWEGSFEGCGAGADCPAFSLNGYVDCPATSHGGTCSAVCAAGGTPTGTAMCWNGVWVSTFSGCTPPPCAAEYTQPGYTVDCELTAGSTCKASCAPGFCGAVSGKATCVDAAWVGTLDGCSPCPCQKSYARVGYVPTSCNATTPGAPAAWNGTQCVLDCDPMTHMGTTSIGEVTCDHGKYVGTPTTCVPQPCTDAYTQTDFVVTGCDAGAAAGSVCTAECASGKCGTISGMVKCVGGIKYSGAFAGCQPCVSCAAHPGKTNYVVTGCDAGTADGTLCTAKCATGYCGPVVGWQKCVAGEYVGQMYENCKPCKCAAYNQAGYVVANCPYGTPSSTTCQATCAPGYCGSVSGGPTCSFGAYSGTFDGCTPCPCTSAYNQTNYVVTGCDADTDHGTVCQATCAGGLCGTAAGTVKCSMGSYTGVFYGCRVCCVDPYTQAGYDITGCGGNTANGASCSATCASGYSGTVMDGVTCSGGSYTGSFSGCA